MKEYGVIKSQELSKPNDDRYVVVDLETGETVDNARGYGFKSAQSANEAFRSKKRMFRQKAGKDYKITIQE